ncbi:hypothetical protein [Poriferisphaera sp. WC338]|uniref:hypothetical protein n=1 Tax=Poriferisphaera sp. WC338 TaxID=3425129 RepID=UPI003D81927B
MGKLINVALVILILGAVGVFGWMMLQPEPETEKVVVRKVEEKTAPKKAEVETVVAEKPKVEVAEAVIEKKAEKKKVAVVKEEVVVEIDPDAERRENFEKSIAEMVELARGDDPFAFFERLLEPGTEMYEQMMKGKEQMANIPPEHLERAKEGMQTMMSSMADLLEGLAWEELEWADDGAKLTLPGMGGRETEGLLYEVAGVWYVKPVRE